LLHKNGGSLTSEKGFWVAASGENWIFVSAGSTTGHNTPGEVASKKVQQPLFSGWFGIQKKVYNPDQHIPAGHKA